MNKTKLLLPVLALSLLSSCALITPKSVQTQAGQEKGRSAEAERMEASGQAQTRSQVAGTQAGPGAAPEDAGINREGRIIDFGAPLVESTPAFTPPETDVVELNYEQADLRQIFEELGDALNLNMIIDPTIADKVSLRTSPDQPLAYADIWPLMRLLAGNAGITIERAGNVYQFSKNASNIPVEIVTPNWLNDATSSIVMQITPLTYVSVESAIEILTPLLQPEGSILRLNQSNALALVGFRDQLSRVNNLLQVIDSDPFQDKGIRLYELMNSQAADVAEELENVLKLIEGDRSSYKVLGLDRINAILVIAPAGRGFAEVNRWINVLDADSQEQVEQLFFYKVKNLDATSLADTLTNVFEQGDEEGNEQSQEQEPEPFVPAALAAGGGGAEGGEAPPAAPQVPAFFALGDATVSADITVTIVADEDTNSLLVRATPREYRQLLTTINNLDTLPRQVLVNAVIGQVTLTEGNQFGVDWTRVSQNANIKNLGTRFLAGGLFNNEGQQAAGSGLVFQREFRDGTSVIDATLQAIAEDNDVTLLARPSLMIINNQEGEIKVGQAVPIDSGTTTTTGGNQIANISYRDTGIVLTVTPHINDDGFVNLELFQSLSAVEEGGPGVAGNPTFTNQEITTTAVVADEATITLGGLIQEEESENSNGVPGLHKVPLLGGLFSAKEFKKSRRELFVILRPTIVKADETDGQAIQEFNQRFKYVSELIRKAGL